MRSYERNGITIEQCTECRGIFLDRGELERLIEAEDVHDREGESGRYGPRYGDERALPDERGYVDEGGYGGYDEGRHGGSGRRRRGGFLGDLLDFG